MKKILIVILAIVTLTFLVQTYMQKTREKEAFEKHESLVKQANECLEAAQWKCAESAIQELLKESPTDYNLHVHMAGILLEQERYDDCLEWISQAEQKDLESITSEERLELHTIQEKAKKLKQEMLELNIESSRHFRLEFEGSPARTDIIEALTVLEVAYDSLQNLFDFYPENKMPVVLYESSDYQGIGPRPTWVAASFDGKLRIPVNLMQNRELYRPILFHELTHCFIRAMARNSIPLWLNEGIAQVVDASKTGAPRPEGDKPTIPELTTSFVKQESTKRALVLYWYSEQMVHGMLERNGDFTTLRKALAEISKTRDIDKVLETFYGTTTESLLNAIE